MCGKEDKLNKMIKDRTFQRYGHLVAFHLDGAKKHRAYWRCRCDCGNIVVIMGDALQSGNTRTCGCQMGRKVKHGAARKGKSAKLYRVWHSMKQRCYNPRSTFYRHYGGRGISVCDQWKNSFIPFQKWAMSNGYREGLTLDRKNNDGNYEPQNCRWATCTVQARNQRSTRLTLEKAKEIRRLKKEGATYRSLSLRFGLSQGHIGDILNNKIWQEDAVI